MSALAKNITVPNDNTSVTKISASARIDYILRFSKQAILVIDESATQDTFISGQFLASLPEEHNAAYISLSGQFNNIQIRCRIIEQLYSGELFDPEISLAVSVTNLSKHSKQPITIALDNAQHLSLQLFHELSQLALIAKKANLVINIVMFGSALAGKTIADNKNLFDNKLTILSAQSGQLLAINSPLFKVKASPWILITQNKWLVGVLAFLLSLSVMVLALLQQDSFNFSNTLPTSYQDDKRLIKVLTSPQKMVIENQNSTDHEMTGQAAQEKTEQQSALPQEIFTLLIAPPETKPVVTQIQPASASDIFSVMTKNLSTIDAAEQKSEITKTAPEPDLTLSKQNPIVQPLKINHHYFAESEGYVIQLAIVSDLNLPTDYLSELESLEYYIYQRILNNKSVMVITSESYPDKATAQLALTELPASILQRQPWIKSIKHINSEINVFLDSQ